MPNPGTESPKFPKLHDEIIPNSVFFKTSNNHLPAKGYIDLPQRTVPPYHSSYRIWKNSNQSKSKEEDGEDEYSGLGTAPLSRSNSPPKTYYESPSASEKAEAIVRGQRELMEMVSKIPDSYYELSLKDLVEQPMVIAASREESDIFDERIRVTEERKVNLSRNGSMNRNRNKSGGFLLKIFPVNCGESVTKKKKKKKKNINSLSRSNSKVSPQTSSLSERSIGNIGIGNDKKSGDKRHHNGSGCWPFNFRVRK